MKRIYLDYASSTPLEPAVLKEMREVEGIFANPQSSHLDGQKARKFLEEARQKVADYIEANPQEIIFTAGATEANRLAIEETFFQVKPRVAPMTIGAKWGKPHLVTPLIEHSSVLEVVEKLEQKGLIEVTRLRPNKEGLITPVQVEKAIKPATFLVTIGYANNEIGVIQPIREIGKLLHKINKNRQEPVYFHTDAAQALLSLNCDVRYLKIDLMTLSSHKIYGPKGAGALFVREGSDLKIDEKGTPNLVGLVGFGKAVELLRKEHLKKPRVRGEPSPCLIDSAFNEKLGMLRDALFYGLVRQIKAVKLNGLFLHSQTRVPHIINLRFEEVDGETLLVRLDRAGISVSLGSACKAGGALPSHVLLALGQSESQARSGLRLSLGKFTTLKEINQIISIIKKTVEDLRSS